MTDIKPPETLKNIIILSGSYAGVSTSHYLLKHGIPKLRNKESYQILLVSSSSENVHRPACPRALISDDLFPQEKLFIRVAKQFEQYSTGSFRFIHGTATELDHANRTVSIRLPDQKNAEKITFHALVIATGASTPSPLLSMNSDAETLRESWAIFRQALPSAKSIVIAGRGPAGIETAGELGVFLNGRTAGGLFSSSKPGTPKVSITVVTASPHILTALRPSIANKAEDFLAQVGVTVLKNSRVRTVLPEGAGTKLLTANTIVILDDGKTLDADVYIPATGTTPNTSFIDRSLLGSDGRVDTNTSSLRVDKANPQARIYAISDASSFASPALHFIWPAIPVLCANIKRDLLLASGKKESEVGEDRVSKEDKRETQIVPIGKSKGVGAAMGWQLPSFLVWLVKGWDYWLWTSGRTWTGSQWNSES